AEPVHVEGPRPAITEQVGPLEPAQVEHEAARARQLQPASALAPRADQRGQAGDVADRHAAAAVALEPIVDADRGRAHGRVLAPEADDPRRRDAGDRLDPRWRPLARALAQLGEADGRPLDVVAIDELL